ncbi:MAG TPA: alpha/beta hydrolase [Gemmataceae bacterium]|nr:alpha/beta hydrolase [Gemmataceae bacterium]
MKIHRFRRPFQFAQSWLAGLCAAGALAGLPGFAAARPLPSAGLYEVDTVLDIPYYDGPGASRTRHRLDIYRPRGAEKRPVLLFLHGGGWMFGDKAYGRYPAVARCLAGQGVVVVMANYRLSPAVKHPEHVRDAARALAWTIKNAERYGGRPDQVFVGGHSAGGHLAALLATNESYLKAEGLDSSAIKGVIPVSGVYRVPEIHVSLKSDGAMLFSSFALDDIDWLPQVHFEATLPRFLRSHHQMAIDLDPFRLVFGSDPARRRDASPLAHVRPGLPPFLVLYAERELPTLDDMAEEFAAALEESRCEVKVFRIAGRGHRDVMLRAVTPSDPVAQHILQFIEQSVVGSP